MKEIDLGWGNPIFLLDILDDSYNPVMTPKDSILNMSYGPDEGSAELIEAVRKVIMETMGVTYKHILITTGTTQAINVCMRVMKKSTVFNVVRTNRLGYPFYSDMIARNGFTRVEDLGDTTDNTCVRLIDSPSNPMGKQASVMFGDPKNTIWDAVYHNRIYTNDLLNKPIHKAMVNSFSKLLGLTGVRIGYIATNDSKFYEDCLHDCLMENATISLPSQNLVIDILKQVELSTFVSKGKESLNRNREEFKKIEYLFGNQRVQERGMFYCAQGDKKIEDLLTKCGIKYVSLEDNIIRLSMGQTNELTREAIERILKEDKK